MRAALGQAVRFGVVGVVNTLVGLAVIYLAMAALRFDDVAANVLGYAVGLAVGFALNRRWTFAHAGRVLPTALRFAVAFVVSYVLNLATMLLLAGGRRAALHDRLLSAEPVLRLPGSAQARIGASLKSMAFSEGLARSAAEGLQ